MKKGIYAILAALIVFALAMTGCPTGGSDSEPPVDFSPTPALEKLESASYEKGTTENVDLRIMVTNAAGITADGGTLSYQWYKADDATSAGTTTGTNSRDYRPAVNVEGTTYYWVIVTNTKGDSVIGTATSNKAAIIIYVPSGDSAIEKIVSTNSAMPLWEFALPAGASWVDYEKFSIEYYVSKDSRIVGIGTDKNPRKVRSRLYGAYLADDFNGAVAEDNANGWGGFRMINWNNSTFITRDGVDSINPNNDFINDNSRGTAKPLGELFTAESGGTSKWFTVKYDTTGAAGGTLVKDFAKVPSLNSETVTAIYMGAGIFQDGGDGTGDYEFYVKNPTLVHKSDPTKSIPGGIFLTGTTEKLFAGNLGATKGGTDREVVTGDYKDVEGEIVISFDLDGGTGDFPAVAIMEGESLGVQFPSAEPTRADHKFLGWYVGDTEVDADTIFDAKTTVTAKWELTVTVSTYEVDLTGQTTKNATAWTTKYNAGLVFKLGDDFNAGLYNTVDIICKFYKSDGTTKVTPPNGNFQYKWYAAEVENANGTAVSTGYNFGATSTENSGPEGGVKITLTLPTAKTSGLWGFGIQTSDVESSPSDDFAQFVEVLSITFPVD